MYTQRVGKNKKKDMNGKSKQNRWLTKIPAYIIFIIFKYFR